MSFALNRGGWRAFAPPRERPGIAIVAAVVTLAVSMLAFGRSDAAGTAAQLSALEEEIAYELNLARRDPAGYATFLEQWKQYYHGKRIERAGKLTILTEEGIVPVEEAIRFLRATARKPALRVSRGMSRGAKDHVRELGPAGAVGHKGLRGSWPTNRINRYGSWRDAVGESIFYGEGTAREIVMSLIIDDGVAKRSHRHAIYDAAFRVVGVGCGAHAKYGTMCVITFAGGYKER